MPLSCRAAIIRCCHNLQSPCFEKVPRFFVYNQTQVFVNSLRVGILVEFVAGEICTHLGVLEPQHGQTCFLTEAVLALGGHHPRLRLFRHESSLSPQSKHCKVASLPEVQQGSRWALMFSLCSGQSQFNTCIGCLASLRVLFILTMHTLTGLRNSFKYAY